MLEQSEQSGTSSDTLTESTAEQQKLELPKTSEQPASEQGELSRASSDALTEPTAEQQKLELEKKRKRE
eukprot:6068758-Alexandrium_andersonii.AAC.1